MIWSWKIGFHVLHQWVVEMDPTFYESPIWTGSAASNIESKDLIFFRELEVEVNFIPVLGHFSSSKGKKANFSFSDFGSLQKWN